MAGDDDRRLARRDLFEIGDPGGALLSGRRVGGPDMDAGEDQHAAERRLDGAEAEIIIRVRLADIDGGELLAGGLDGVSDSLAIGQREAAIDQHGFARPGHQNGSPEEAVLSGWKMLPGESARGMAEACGCEDCGGARGESGFHDGSPCRHVDLLVWSAVAKLKLDGPVAV